MNNQIAQTVDKLLGGLLTEEKAEATRCRTRCYRCYRGRRLCVKKCCWWKFCKTYYYYRRCHH